ncbi:MAG: leucyl aminopeptidase family protein [Steroidobacteraceae bacterium]
MAVSNANSRPIRLVSESSLAAFVASQNERARASLTTQGFNAERHRALLLPNEAGDPAATVVLGVGPLESLERLRWWQVAGLPDKLPAGRYHFADELSEEALYQCELGWRCGDYRFLRYRAAPTGPRAQLAPRGGAASERAERRSMACHLTRDLINTPANDMGPAELETALRDLATRYGAEFHSVVGDDLLGANYPLVHAVGRASHRPPRMLELRWGDDSHPRVTLVGKGVCFDSGGLDIKPASAMLLMKKDMGGAAVALGLAKTLMDRNASLRLRVLVPAVENAIGGSAFRPGDVLRSRRGLTVEIGNTDAEGRLVLADALTEAQSDRPDLVVDFATLTGAARVALGPELPALFSNDLTLSQKLQQMGDLEGDPVWPLPLWDPYDDELSSRIADLNNVSSSSFSGAIFGALFLRRFIEPATPWVHFDLYGWNARERPGRPVGADAQVVRLMDRYLAERFG